MCINQKYFNELKRSRTSDTKYLQMFYSNYRMFLNPNNYPFLDRNSFFNHYCITQSIFQRTNQVTILFFSENFCSAQPQESTMIIESLSPTYT